MYFYLLEILLKESLDRLIASSNLSLNNNFGSTLAHLSQAATLKFNLKTFQLNQEAAAQCSGHSTEAESQANGRGDPGGVGVL